LVLGSEYRKHKPHISPVQPATGHFASVHGDFTNSRFESPSTGAVPLAFSTLHIHVEGGVRKGERPFLSLKIFNLRISKRIKYNKILFSMRLRAC
jgi:hypothetical protein